VSAETSFSYGDHGPSGTVDELGPSTLATIVAFLRRLFHSDRG